MASKESKLSESFNEFTLDVYKNLANKDNENLFMSPRNVRCPWKHRISDEKSIEARNIRSEIDVCSFWRICQVYEKRK